MKNEFEYYTVKDWWNKYKGDFVSVNAAIDYFDSIDEDTNGYTVYHYSMVADKFGRVKTTELGRQELDKFR